MKTEFVLTYADWLVAQRACYGNRYKFKWLGLSAYLMARWLIFVLSAIALVFAMILLLVQGRGALPTVVPLIAVATVWLALFAWCRYWARKVFRETHGEKMLIEVTVTDSGVGVTRPGMAATQYQWEGIKAFLDDQNFFLLYLSKRLFLPIAKSGISTAEQALTSELIGRHVQASRP